MVEINLPPKSSEEEKARKMKEDFTRELTAMNMDLVLKLRELNESVNQLTAICMQKNQLMARLSNVNIYFPIHTVYL